MCFDHGAARYIQALTPSIEDLKSTLRDITWMHEQSLQTAISDFSDVNAATGTGDMLANSEGFEDRMMHPNLE